VIGDCTVTQIYDYDTNAYRLRIDQADERITIVDEILGELTERGWAGEGAFMIEAENGTVRYRLVGRSLTVENAWLAERIGPDPSVVKEA
jgi:hypothetical protein